MNIIITGASRGIGYEVVRRFSRAGGHKIIAVSRNHEKLLQLQKEFEKGGSPVDILAGDLVEEEFRENLVTLVKEKMGAVHILLNNAGQLINKPFGENTPEDFDTIYRVNVFGPAMLIRALLPLMERGNSHVVNIGSMGGYQGSMKFPGLSAYSSSKAALANLTECLAEEYGKEGIRFNCLCLGSVQTDMLAAAFPGFKAQIGASEMAKFICEFCCEGGQLFNGKIIPVSLSTP